MARYGPEVTSVAPVAPIDYLLEKLTLPRLDPLLSAVSPQHVISEVLGIPTIGDLAETFLERVSSDIGSRKVRLPGPWR